MDTRPSSRRRLLGLNPGGNTLIPNAAGQHSLLREPVEPSGGVQRTAVQRTAVQRVAGRPGSNRYSVPILSSTAVVRSNAAQLELSPASQGITTPSFTLGLTSNSIGTVDQSSSNEVSQVDYFFPPSSQFLSPPLGFSPGSASSFTTIHAAYTQNASTSNREYIPYAHTPSSSQVVHRASYTRDQSSSTIESRFFSAHSSSSQTVGQLTPAVSFVTARSTSSQVHGFQDRQSGQGAGDLIIKTQPGDQLLDADEPMSGAEPLAQPLPSTSLNHPPHPSPPESRSSTPEPGPSNPPTSTSRRRPQTQVRLLLSPSTLILISILGRRACPFPADQARAYSTPFYAR